MAILYTGPTGNGRKPLVLSKLLNAPIKVHMFHWPTKDIQEDWYLKLNPAGIVPTLVDDKGTPITESNNILLYIADTYDKEHKFFYSLEQDPKLYWEQNELLFYQATQFQSQTLTIANANYQNGHIDENIAQYVLSSFEKVFAFMETKLSGRDWFVGDKFTIVDIAFLVGEHRRRERLHNSPIWIDLKENFPNVEKWFQRAIAFENVEEILKEHA